MRLANTAQKPTLDADGTPAEGLSLGAEGSGGVHALDDPRQILYELLDLGRGHDER